MKLLRYLKVLSITVAAVAVVGSLVVCALVPRDAIVDYFPVLQDILPPPAAKPKPVEAKAPVVDAVKKTDPVVALPETITFPFNISARVSNLSFAFCFRAP